MQIVSQNEKISQMDSPHQETYSRLPKQQNKLCRTLSDPPKNNDGALEEACQEIERLLKIIQAREREKIELLHRVDPESGGKGNSQSVTSGTSSTVGLSSVLKYKIGSMFYVKGEQARRLEILY